MPDPINTDQLLSIVRGQSSIEAKLDIFIKTQESMRTDFTKAQDSMRTEFVRSQDAVKSDVEDIKIDIQAIKSANTSYKAYVQAAVAIVTIIWGGFTLFVLPILHRKLGLG